MNDHWEEKKYDKCSWFLAFGISINSQAHFLYTLKEDYNLDLRDVVKAVTRQGSNWLIFGLKHCSYELEETLLSFKGTMVRNRKHWSWDMVGIEHLRRPGLVTFLDGKEKEDIVEIEMQEVQKIQK